MTAAHGTADIARRRWFHESTAVAGASRRCLMPRPEPSVAEMRTRVRWVLTTALIVTGCGPASGGRSGAGGASNDASGSAGSPGGAGGSTGTPVGGSGGAASGSGGGGTSGARDGGIATDLTSDASPFENNVYVSPGGSDDNPGTVASPVQTLQKAQQLVRRSNANMTSDITVTLADGYYRMTSPLTLDPSDSGTNSHNVSLDRRRRVHIRRSSARSKSRGGRRSPGSNNVWMAQGPDWHQDAPVLRRRHARRSRHRRRSYGGRRWPPGKIRAARSHPRWNSCTSGVGARGRKDVAPWPR